MSGVIAAGNRNSVQQPNAYESSEKVDEASSQIKDRLSQSWKDWDVSYSDLAQISEIVDDLSTSEKNAVIAQLSKHELQTWGNELNGTIGGLSSDAQISLYKSLAQDLDAYQLSRVFSAFGEDHQSGLTSAIETHASSTTRVDFVENIQQKALSDIDVPEGLTDEQKALYIDLAQLGLDIVGIAEPTPFADGSSGIISLFRGDWLSAGLSALSIIPYVGDLAKLGKLGKWGRTVTNVIEAASKSEEFADVAKPVLEQIAKGINKIPDSVFNKLPKNAQDTLLSLRTKIDNFLSGKVSPSGSPGGKPTGPKTEVHGSSEVKRSLQRENESAEILADKGYKVEQNPGKRPDNNKESDYKIEGEYFDSYAPNTGNIDRVRNKISDKVGEGQASRIVVNLKDSDLSPQDVMGVLQRKPISGLEEVLVINKSGDVVSFFPQ